MRENYMGSATSNFSGRTQRGRREATTSWSQSNDGSSWGEEGRLNRVKHQFHPRVTCAISLSEVRDKGPGTYAATTRGAGSGSVVAAKETTRLFHPQGDQEAQPAAGLRW